MLNERQREPAPDLIERARLAIGSGDLRQAEALCRTALNRHPECGLAAITMADIQLRKGNAHKARAFAREAALRDVGGLDLLGVTAPAAIAIGERSVAAQCMSQFQELAPPKQAELLMYWAERLEDLFMFDQAASVLKPLAEARQADYNVLVYYAQLLLKAHRAEAATAVLERAVALAPDRPGARLAQIRQRIQLGQIDAAIEVALEVLRDDPGSVPAASMLSEIAPGRIPEPSIVTLQEVLRETGGDSENRAAAGLALGRVLEARENHDLAFDAFSQANHALKLRARRRGRDYDPPATEHRVDTLKRTFPLPHDRAADAGQGLIFIVGMPRSGTTLLDRILAAHARVRSVGEHPVMPALAVRASVESGDPERFEELMHQSGDELRAQYLSSLPYRPSAERFIVDKLPLNFWNVGLIARLFPRASVIHSRRDPRDVGLSSFRLRFPDSFDYVNDFDDFAHYYAQHERLMRHWHRVFPGWIATADYEQLVHSIEPSVRALLAHCGLPWDAACLKFPENREAVYTLSMGQVRRELYRDATGRWRRYAAHMAPLERELERHGVELPAS